MTIEINIIEGDKYSEFREQENLDSLKEILGESQAEKYFKGFSFSEELTLEVFEDKLVGSALIEIEGGTFRIRELVFDEEHDKEVVICDAFDVMTETALEYGCHKMWLIDSPKLKRIGLFKKNGFVEEGKLERNVLEEEEYLMCKFTEGWKSPQRRTNLKIGVVKGNIHGDFRQKLQIESLKRKFREKSQRYYDGFKNKERMTLEIKNGEELIGSAGIEITGGIFRISSFMIKKEYRGRGIGTDALLKMEETARKIGCHKMWLITNPQLRVVNLYKRMGWGIETELKNNVAHQDELLMRKFLNE